MAQEPNAKGIIHLLELHSPLDVPIDDTLMSAAPPSVYTIEKEIIKKDDLDYWLRWEGLDWIFNVIKTQWSRLIEKPNGDRIVIFHPRPQEDELEYLNDAIWHMFKLLQLGDGSENTEHMWHIVKAIACPRCKLHYLMRQYHTRVVMLDTESEVEEVD